MRKLFENEERIGHNVWVEGIIGCGKTTLVNKIKDELGWEAFYEPINLDLLGKYYKDQKRWGFAFQIDLLHRRYALQQEGAYKVLRGINIINDRGLPGDRVFAKMLRNTNKMSLIEWNIYERAYNTMARSLVPPSLVIFMDVEPEIAQKRIRERDRPQERDLIPLSYLENLRIGYMDLIDEIESGNHAWSKGMKVKIWTFNDDQDSTAEVVNYLRSFENE